MPKIIRPPIAPALRYCQACGTSYDQPPGHRCPRRRRGRRTKAAKTG